MVGLFAGSLLVPAQGAWAQATVTSQQVQEDVNDPFEGTNRFFFRINDFLDDVFLRPAAVIYRAAIPEFGRNRVRNFMNNLDAPVVFANDILQGEIDRAGDTFLRFGINTTFGIGGLFDVATDWGIPFHDEDFGQTLAVWGAGEGPYAYLPILGPSNFRDSMGRLVDIGFDPLTYVHWGQYDYVPWVRTAVNVIDLRSRNIETLDEIERTSVDYYASIRSIYRQYRKNEILNGEAGDLPDFDKVPLPEN